MRCETKENLYLFLQRQIPFLMCLFLLLIGLFPFKIPFLTQHTIPLIFIAIFCWTVFRPDLLSAFSVFVLGVLADLIYYVPFGLQTILFLLFYLTLIKIHRILLNRSFLFLWGSFAALSLPLMLMLWGLLSLMSWKSVPFGTYVGQYILLVALYPFIEIVCGLFYEKYLDDRL